MSCPLHNNDWSCAGCAKVKIKHLEIKKESQALYIKRLEEALANIRDDDQLRGFQYQDIAREALEGKG